MPEGAPTGSRGKLYSLAENSEWCEIGIGRARVVDGHLRVLDEEGGGVLHDRPLFSQDTYQLQGDKHLVWEDLDFQRDWALSFETGEGASEVWEALCAQAPAAVAEPLEVSRIIPLPTLGNLAQVARILTFVPPSQREPLAAECGRADFIQTLKDAFHTAEDLDDEEALAAVFQVVKGVFLLSNQSLSERYLADGMYEDTMGMLEHDEGLPVEKRVAHREVLKVKVSFQSVLPLEDESMLQKIHLTFRLGYVKDIVLPRLLDDGSFAALTQMIYANISSIMEQLLKRPALLQQLLSRVEQKDALGLRFLLDLCRLARNVPPPQRQALHDCLVEHRLLQVLLPLLASQDSAQPRAIASEVLLLVATNDSAALRRSVLAEAGCEGASGSAALGALVQVMLTEDDQGIQSQAADTVKATLDLTAMGAQDREAGLDALYQAGCLDALAAPLKGDFAGLGHSACFGLQLACEVLAYAVAAHGPRAKLFMMRNGLAQHAGRLVAEAPHRFLQLPPIRLLRAAVGTKDDACNRYLVKSGAFAPILRTFHQTLGPLGLGGNLLVSATLELLDFIRTENIEVLVAHLATKHSGLLTELGAKFKTVEGLLLRHAQNLEREAAGVGPPLLAGPVAVGLVPQPGQAVASPAEEAADADAADGTEVQASEADEAATGEDAKAAEAVAEPDAEGAEEDAVEETEPARFDRYGGEEEAPALFDCYGEEGAPDPATAEAAADEGGAPASVPEDGSDEFPPKSCEEAAGDKPLGHVAKRQRIATAVLN